MNFEKHSTIEGTHAPFGASQSAWLRYDDEKAINVLKSKNAAKLGTRLHEWAKETIDLGIKQPRSNKTLYAYVNDAIGFKMDTEVVLYYSEYFYGTADAISFRNGKLRIHDLKTGDSGHMEQLEIYAALFCLEYGVSAAEIEIELRLYKNDEIMVFEPPAEEIFDIMDKIVHLDSIFREYEGKEIKKNESHRGTDKISYKFK